MKKYFLLLLFILLSPFMVLADASGPSIIGYDAVIVNENGIKYTDFANKTTVIPYNSKVRVVWESGDSVTISYVLKNGEEITTGVDKKDILPYDEEINPNTYKSGENEEDILYKEKSSVIVFDKNGIKLRKGPSEAWKEYDEIIDYMTVLDTTYTMYGDNFRGNAANKWFYVENDKYHGWVNTSKIGYKVDMEVLSFSKGKLLNDSGKEIATIPEETVLDEIYIIEGTNQFYVKYNFEQGFIDLNYYNEKTKKEVHNFDYGVKVTDYVVAKKDTQITSIDGKVRKNIPYGSKINVIYAFMESEPPILESINGYFYGEYAGQKGFIKESDVFVTYYDESQNKFDSKKFTLTHATELYSYNDEKPIMIIDENNTFDSPYCFVNYYDQNGDVEEEWCAVKYQNNYGYVLINKKVNDIVVINNTDTDIISTPKLVGIIVSGYNLNFESRKYQYTLKINDEKKLDLNIIKEADSDEIEIIDNENLKNGSVIKIIVRRDNKVSRYFINIEKSYSLIKSGTILYIVVGALLLAILVFGMILIINRKKKKNVIVDRSINKEIEKVVDNNVEVTSDNDIKEKIDKEKEDELSLENEEVHQEEKEKIVPQEEQILVHKKEQDINRSSENIVKRNKRKRTTNNTSQKEKNIQNYKAKRKQAKKN